MVNVVTYECPVGPLALVSDGTGLTGIHFPGWVRPDHSRAASDTVLDSARRQLDAYFSGRRTRFDLLLAPVGTPFQLAVWSALLEIPYGETRSYGQLAAALGKPAATRAVGAANGRNPIAIVVPCHRVIGANGSLTGFGGGLERKKFLLSLEQGRELRLTA
jgi:methylated-DNA-[protein]-cysteine S-methyltransferase